MHNYKIANTDTDSIMFCKRDGTEFSKDEQINLLAELNAIMPELIRWEDDGVFSKVVILKAKNYVLYDGKKIAIKGSGLKVTMKELALKEMVKRFIDSLLEISQESLTDIYHSYVREVHNITDISRWTSKKTITQSVLNPSRTTEQKILDALDGKNFSEGDKIRVYFKYKGIVQKEVSDTKTGKVRKTKEKIFVLRCEEDWNNDHSVEKLLGKIFMNIQIFKNVVDIKMFPNYNLSKNKKLLEDLIAN